MKERFLVTVAFDNTGRKYTYESPVRLMESETVYVPVGKGRHHVTVLDCAVTSSTELANIAEKMGIEEIKKVLGYYNPNVEDHFVSFA